MEIFQWFTVLLSAILIAIITLTVIIQGKKYYYDTEDILIIITGLYLVVGLLMASYSWCPFTIAIN